MGARVCPLWSTESIGHVPPGPGKAGMGEVPPTSTNPGCPDHNHRLAEAVQRRTGGTPSSLGTRPSMSSSSRAVLDAVRACRYR